MQPMFCNLGHLGSRFNLIFDPERKQVHHGALGLYLDAPMDLSIGLEDPKGRRRILPLGRAAKTLDWAEVDMTPTSVTWSGTWRQKFIHFSVTFTAPFWPQDEQTTLWPGFYIHVRIRPMKHVRWKRDNTSWPALRVFLQLDRRDTRVATRAGGLDLHYRTPIVPSAADYPAGELCVPAPTRRTAYVREWLGPVEDGWQCEQGRLVADVEPNDAAELELPPLAWVAHTTSTVFEANKTPGRLRYVRHWPTLKDAIKHGRRNAKRLLDRTRRFDALINGSALPSAAKQLFAQSFNSYLANTWWCDLQKRGEESRPWFSVWEGSCLFNSTVDVEYNTSLLYFALWPELLSMTLVEWLEHLKTHPRAPGRYVDHDMGPGTLANTVRYENIMGVEEAGNFLLLLAAHVRFSGARGVLRARGMKEAVRDVVDYLLWTDQGGRGFPTEDVWNTIDDGSPAIQFGREQTYLAIKRMTALLAAEQIGVALGARRSRQISEAVAQARRTLDKEAWQGDHFAVCIDPRAENAINRHTGEPIGEGELPGWQDPHIYSPNGLLMMLLFGGIDDKTLLDRLRADIEHALPATLTPYGCSHNAGDPLNVWISQNLWRDCVAHYLHAAVPDLSARYFALQQWSNTCGQGKCFIDTYLYNDLCFYPRGITVAGYLLSLAGLRIDRKARQVHLDPVIKDGVLPLLPLADWRRGRVPVLEARGGSYRLLDDGPIHRAGLEVVWAKRKQAGRSKS